MKPRIKLTKDRFSQIINALIEQNKRDKEKSDAFQVLLPESFVCYVDGNLEELILNLLKEAFKDEGDWIAYWVYELDYGDKYTPGTASYKDGKDIDLSSVGALYDFLLINMSNE